MPGYQRKRFWKIIVLIFFTGLVDLLGLASIIPVISAVADPSILEEGSFLGNLKARIGIVDQRIFIILLFLFVSVLLFLRVLFILFSQKIQASFIQEYSKYFGKKVYEYYLSSDFQNFLHEDSSKIIRELTSNARSFASMLILPLLIVFSEFTMILMIVTGIAVFNISVFLLLSFTIFPALFFLLRIVKKRLRSYGKIQNEGISELLSSSSRGILGFIDVKLRNKERLLINEYERNFSELNKIAVKVSVLSIIPSKLFELTVVLALFVILLYSFFLSINNESIISIITLYAAAAYRVIPALSKIAPALMSLEQYNYLLDLYKKVMRSKEGSNQDIISSNQVSFTRQIQLKDVGFKFKDSEYNLFSQTNLKIKSGEVIGIIGKSGSGKTSLVNLITGFYFPSNGKIFVDDIEINENNVAAWRYQISYVQQSSYLEKNSLTKNIAFLENNVDYDRLLYAIQGAGLIELLGDSHPDDFWVDERGKNLSGGQKQRIVIARALYNKSKLIVLDEATSALDSDTEETINDTIAGLRGTGITIIIIAHRISTLKHTDKIYKIENGKIDSEMFYSDLSI